MLLIPVEVYAQQHKLQHEELFFSCENVKKRVMRAVRITYKRGVLQDDLCLIQGEVEPDDITVSVSVHHL